MVLRGSFSEPTGPQPTQLPQLWASVPLASRWNSADDALMARTQLLNTLSSLICIQPQPM